MAKISKQAFWRIIKNEIAYFNKKWVGETEAEKRENERNVLSMYYDSLSGATEYSLEIAFRNHRNKEIHFPKVPQILKLLPRESETYQSKSYKRAPMPDNVKSMQKAKAEVTDEMKLASANMIANRYENTSFAEAKKIVGLVV